MLSSSGRKRSGANPTTLNYNASAVQIYNATNRVTRLGEFPPFGQFLKITIEAQIFELLFPTDKVMQ
jgi:hypothetical protein